MTGCTRSTRPPAPPPTSATSALPHTTAISSRRRGSTTASTCRQRHEEPRRRRPLELYGGRHHSHDRRSAHADFLRSGNGRAWSSSPAFSSRGSTRRVREPGAVGPQLRRRRRQRRHDGPAIVVDGCPQCRWIVAPLGFPNPQRRNSCRRPLRSCRSLCRGSRSTARRRRCVPELAGRRRCRHVGQRAFDAIHG